MTQNVELNAGELVCFSRGEYSDYSVGGHFVALQSVSHEEMIALVDELRKEEAAQEDSEDSEYGYASLRFIGAMIRKGWLLDVHCREIHTGSYGELDLS